MKVLQNAFAKNQIKRHLEVEKLVKAKYQDNLEFCQWLKRYWDINNNGEPYDALTLRHGQDLYYIAGGNKVNFPNKAGAVKAQPRPTAGIHKSSTMPTAAIGAGAKKPVVGQTACAKVDTKKVQELEGAMDELKLNMDTVEKERDFYFGKLRDIENLLQAAPEELKTAITEKVMQVLYASEQEKVEIDKDGNLSIVPIDGAEGNEEG